MHLLRLTTCLTVFGFAGLAAAATCPADSRCLLAVERLHGAPVPTATGSHAAAREAGVLFQANVGGTIDTLRFWRSAADRGIRTAHIWSARTHRLLATVEFADTDETGWQSAELPEPPRVVAGERYIASIDTRATFAAATAPAPIPAFKEPRLIVRGTAQAALPGSYPAAITTGAEGFLDVGLHVTSTLFGTLRPGAVEGQTAEPRELGTRFTPSVDGRVTELRFYNTGHEAGRHVGHLWDSQGRLLASVVFRDEAGTGWRTAALTRAVPVTAGQSYVVSVNANKAYAVTAPGRRPPGSSSRWISPSRSATAGVVAAKSQYPAQSSGSASHFRDVGFQPAATAAAAASAPFDHRGWLGWIRDLATAPYPQGAHWPYNAIDQGLKDDYDQAGTELHNYGLNEMQIWGLADAAGNSDDGGATVSNGYNNDVTISDSRRADATSIIQNLQGKGIAVLAGTGLLSWGFNVIAANNPSIACAANPYVVDPSQDLSWQYMYRIANLLMGLGVNGLTVQPGDQGTCSSTDVSAPGGGLPYHAPNVQRFANWFHDSANYPNALLGAANFGVPFTDRNQESDLVRMASNLTYLIDVYNPGLEGDRTYRAQIISEIAPTEFGTDAEPQTNAPTDVDRLGWFLPTAQTAVGNMRDLYADGGRAAENYMRALYNPGEEYSALLLFSYEANPDSDFTANSNGVLSVMFQTQDTNVLSTLSDIFTRAENAYFANAYGSNILIRNYSVYSDTGRPYLRDNMSASGRQAYRTVLVDLLSEAQGIRNSVGSPAEVDRVTAGIQATINDIDQL